MLSLGTPRGLPQRGMASRLFITRVTEGAQGEGYPQGEGRLSPGGRRGCTETHLLPLSLLLRLVLRSLRSAPGQAAATASVVVVVVRICRAQPSTVARALLSVEEQQREEQQREEQQREEALLLR